MKKAAYLGNCALNASAAAMVLMLSQPVAQDNGLLRKAQQLEDPKIYKDLIAVQRVRRISMGGAAYALVSTEYPGVLDSCEIRAYRRIGDKEVQENLPELMIEAARKSKTVSQAESLGVLVRILARDLCPDATTVFFESGVASI